MAEPVITVEEHKKLAHVCIPSTRELETTGSRSSKTSSIQGQFGLLRPSFINKQTTTVAATKNIGNAES